MPKVTICRGLPASGKSTWAKKQDAVRINKDDLRAMLDGGKWSGKREKLVIDTRDSIMVKALRQGRNVIIDDTNLHPKHINRISEVVEAQAQIDGKEYSWEVKDFDIKLHDAIKRDVKREHSVGEDVIRNMWNQFIRPTKRIVKDPLDEVEAELADEGSSTVVSTTVAQDLPDAVIFDLDGTLADISGRNPYDASQCEYDKLVQPVYNDLVLHQKAGYKIIICSGRSNEYVEQTDAWLKKNGIAPDLFIMRDPNDVDEKGNRIPDDELKQKMFMEHIHNKYNVEKVFDDRQKVVDMWRDLGLTVFQVADGRF